MHADQHQVRPEAIPSLLHSLPYHSVEPAGGQKPAPTARPHPATLPALKPRSSLSSIPSSSRKAKEDGVTGLCMGAAWLVIDGRKGGFKKIIQMVKKVRAMGLEVCITLGGGVSPKQAHQLREAGLTAYNHNCGTFREFYPKIITARTCDVRLATIKNVRQAGISVCLGGIIGLARETKRQHAFAPTWTLQQPVGGRRRSYSTGRARRPPASDTPTTSKQPQRQVILPPVPPPPPSVHSFSHSAKDLSAYLKASIERSPRSHFPWLPSYLNSLPEDIVPTPVYNIALEAAYAANQLRDARRLLLDMERRLIRRDPRTWAILIESFGWRGDIGPMREVLHRALSSGKIIALETWGRVLAGEALSTVAKVGRNRYGKAIVQRPRLFNPSKSLLNIERTNGDEVPALQGQYMPESVERLENLFLPAVPYVDDDTVKFVVRRLAMFGRLDLAKRMAVRRFRFLAQQTGLVDDDSSHGKPVVADDHTQPLNLASGRSPVGGPLQSAERYARMRKALKVWRGLVHTLLSEALQHDMPYNSFMHFQRQLFGASYRLFNYTFRPTEASLVLQLRALERHYHRIPALMTIIDDSQKTQDSTSGYMMGWQALKHVLRWTVVSLQSYEGQGAIKDKTASFQSRISPNIAIDPKTDQPISLKTFIAWLSRKIWWLDEQREGIDAHKELDRDKVGTALASSTSTSQARWGGKGGVREDKNMCCRVWMPEFTKVTGIKLVIVKLGQEGQKSRLALEAPLPAWMESVPDFLEEDETDFEGGKEEEGKAEWREVTLQAGRVHK